MTEAVTGSVASILLRRWWAVVSGLALGILLGFVLLQVLPATYAATSTLLIKGVPGTGAGANLSAAQYASSRASSYPTFIGSSVVLEGVRSDLADGTTAAALREDLSASNPIDSPLVHITGRASSAEQAQIRANSAARHMARFISQIETVGGVSPVVVETAVQAELPTQASSPQPALVMGLGVAAGLTLGVVGAFVLAELARRGRHGSAAAAVGRRPATVAAE